MQSKPTVFAAPVAATLEILAEQLIEGEIGLQDLPAPLAAFYYLGAAESRAHHEATIREPTHECDRLYLAAAHPAKRAALLQHRLDEHFAHENEQFFVATQPETIAA